MRKWKAILALALILALMLALTAGCAKTNKESADTGTTKDTTAAASDEQETAPTDTDDGTEAADAGEDEELAHVNFWFYCNSTWKDEADVTDPVLEKINEILREKCNAEISWTLLQPADYKDKVGLALSGGEVIDILATMPMGRINNYYNQGMLMDITDLLTEYAPDALALTEDLNGGYTFDGRIYGVPTIRNLPSSTYTYFYTECLEKVGMVEKFHEMKSFDDYEEVLAALSTLIDSDGIYPLGGDANGIGIPNLLSSMDFDDYNYVETVGETTGTVFVEDGTVQNLIADERYENKLKLIKDWYEKGYIWPDSLYNTQNMADDLMKQKVIAGVINGSEYGVEAIKEGLMQADLEVFQVTSPVIGSVTASLWGVSIPTTAEEPEAACRVINEMWTNADLMNLFVHGIEGKDYNVVDGQAQYVEEPHYSNGQHVIGNALLTYPIMGQGADFFEVVKELNSTAILSEYMGFVLNTDELDLHISNIGAVTDQYKQSMINGGYTEEAYQEYVSKLEAAGWADYAAEVQKQLDAFVAAR